MAGRQDTLDRAWEPRAIEAMARRLPDQIDEAAVFNPDRPPHVSAWVMARLALAALADLDCDPADYRPAVQAALDAWADERGVDVPSLDLPEIPV